MFICSKTSRLLQQYACNLRQVSCIAQNWVLMRIASADFLACRKLSFVQRLRYVAPSKMTTAKFFLDYTSPFVPSYGSHLHDRRNDSVYLDRIFRCCLKSTRLQTFNAKFPVYL